MRRYYVAFLASSGPKNQHPFEILYPAGGQSRQFDTLAAAKASRDMYRGRATSKDLSIGSWEIVDLFQTVKSLMLVVVK